MTDYGHELLFGANLIPSSEHPDTVVAPAMLAQSATSLDLLSGGRFELALGAGGFWDAIASMGGPRRTPGQAVAALEEAIAITRAAWDPPGEVIFHGEHHSIDGMARGPRPAHDVAIWVGGYRPRMLELIGRAADGWLPSLPRLEELEALERGNAVIDEAAERAGRRPAGIRRLLNLAEEPPAEQLAELALTYGTSVFTLLTMDPARIRRFGEETAPAVRELVAKERVVTPR